jgi:OFA family oxalate/formate antiporter-like MFS transporter
LFACFLIIFIHYAIRYSYGTLLPEMLPSLSINKAQAGIIYSSYFIAYTVLSPILGFLSDRYNVRIILAIFVALMGGGALLMAYPTSELQASLFFALAGAGCSACWAPVMALAQRWTSDRRRGMSLAFIDAGSSLGVMSAGTIIPLIVVAYDWRAGWMSLGILGFVSAIVSFFLIRSYPKAESNPAAKPGGGERIVGITYKELFCDKHFWLVGLAYLFTGFAIIVPFTFISTYAVQELSFPYDSATRLVTIIGAGGITGKLLLGPISDKWGRIKIMVISAILIAVGNLAVAYSRGWMLMAFTFIFGLGYGACWSMYAACASDFFSKQAAGGIIGLWTVYLGIGTMLSPIIAGWIADTTGTLMWSFLIAMLGGVASLLLLLPMVKVPPTSSIRDKVTC